MPRWVVFVGVGLIAAIVFVPHRFSAYEPTGRTVDLGVVTGPYGEPIPGPGQVAEQVCVAYDEKLATRAGVVIVVATVLTVLGWGASVPAGTPIQARSIGRYAAGEITTPYRP